MNFDPETGDKLNIFLAYSLKNAPQNYQGGIISLQKDLASLDRVGNVHLFDDGNPEQGNPDNFRSVVLSGLDDCALLLVVADNPSANLGYLIAQAEKIGLAVLVVSYGEPLKLMSDYQYLEVLSYKYGSINDAVSNGLSGSVLRIVRHKMSDRDFWPIKAYPGMY